MENQSTEPTEEQRLALIKAIVKKVQSGDSTFAVDQDLLNEFKADKATEDFVVEHGLLEATKEDVLDEAERLDALDHKEEIDFDSDENEVDMENVSSAMRGAFA